MVIFFRAQIMVSNSSLIKGIIVFPENNCAFSIPLHLIAKRKHRV